MNLASTLDRLHTQARSNRWLWLFTIFTRIGLAAGFIPSGLVKIFGERFTSLTVMHPMGHYLYAFFRTGFYYPFVGVMQVLAAILLLIPRTATLGAMIYFPIILNICILSLSVRFEGSLVTSPLMVVANLYLFCWDYHKLKYILPFNRLPVPKPASFKFPVRFAAVSFTFLVVLILLLTQGFNIYPRNTTSDCNGQCDDSKNRQACYDFCDCIHKSGKALDECLETYNKALKTN